MLMIMLDRCDYSEGHILDTYLSMPMHELLSEYNLTEKALRLLLSNMGAHTFACEYLDWLVSAMQGIICDRFVCEYGLSNEYRMND